MNFLIRDSAGPSGRWVDHIGPAHNADGMNDPDATAWETGACGDSIEVFMKVRQERIVEIMCRPHGCGYTRACADAMSKLAVGLGLDEALELDETVIINQLESLPEDHHHCARLAVHALDKAIDHYYRRQAQSKGD